MNRVYLFDISFFNESKLHHFVAFKYYTIIVCFYYNYCTWIFNSFRE